MELSDRIRDALGALLVEGLVPPPNYSLRRARRSPSGHRPEIDLYRSRCLILRTRDVDRAVRALARCMARHVAGEDGLLRLRQAAVVDGSEAIVLPNQLYPSLEAIESGLIEHGFHIVDPPFVAIDPRTRELVVNDLFPAATGLDGSSVGRTGGWPDSLDRYAIREWAILRRSDEDPIAVHEGMAATLPLVEGLASESNGPSEPIRGLARTLERIRITPIWYQGRARLLERVTGAG